MNRRSLIRKVFGALALFLPVKLFAQKEARWKHLAINTKDVSEHPSFDGAMTQILEDLTICANRAIGEARNSNEPLARMDFAWRRIRFDNKECCFARFIAIKGDKSLGPLHQMPNEAVQFTSFTK